VFKSTAPSKINLNWGFHYSWYWYQKCQVFWAVMLRSSDSLTFQRILPPSSGSKHKPRTNQQKQRASWTLLTLWPWRWRHYVPQNIQLSRTTQCYNPEDCNHSDDTVMSVSNMNDIKCSLDGPGCSGLSILLVMWTGLTLHVVHFLQARPAFIIGFLLQFSCFL
jgi:hypothetical protein